MRVSWRWWLRLVLIVVALVLLLMRLVPRGRKNPAIHQGIADLSLTSPLNQPGGAPAPPDAYSVYSALYQTSSGEPLAIAEKSVTDIPQVGTSCLKPATPQQKEMAEAFAAANQQSHRWEKRFTIPGGYQLLSQSEATAAQNCLATHGRDAAQCAAYRQIRHVRFLGVPGFDRSHTQALVSVIRSCGGFCGSGGIFVVEKSPDGWKRSETTDFTRDCSWMY